MLWGLPSGSDPSWTAAAENASTKHILGFNEPDLTYSGSANILPANAAAGYKTYMEPFAGRVQISTPNVLWNNVGYSSGGNYGSATWMQYFLGNCTGCHFDFAGIHLYQQCLLSDGTSSASQFENWVTNAWDVLKLPIWVTEFNCGGTDAEQISWMKEVLPWLDAQSYVQRYAYLDVSAGLLINTTTGDTLSDTGIVYATL
jgi:hypothetical protein